MLPFRSRISLLPVTILLAVSFGACGSSSPVVRLTDGEIIGGVVVDEDRDAIYFASHSPAGARRVPRALIAARGVAETSAPVAGLVTMGIGGGIILVSAASIQDCSGEGLCGLGNIGPVLGLAAGGIVLLAGVVVTAIQSGARPTYHFQTARRPESPAPGELTFALTPTGAALTW